MRAGKNAEKRRVALKMGSWNVNNFAQRAGDVDFLLASEEIDVLFVCETLKKRLKSGIILPLKFEGSIDIHSRSEEIGERQADHERPIPFKEEGLAEAREREPGRHVVDARGAP